MTKDVDFEDMARHIMFGKTSERDVLETYGAVYRKGKSITDLNHAINKGLKNGMGKTEFELGMIEIYLKDMFKKKSIHSDTTKKKITK